MHSNNTKTIVLVLVALIAGLIIGYLLSGKEQVVVAADNSAYMSLVKEIGSLHEEVVSLRNSLGKIEECACRDIEVQCGTIYTVTEVVEVPVTVTVPVTDEITITIITTDTKEASDEIIVNIPDDDEPVVTSTPVPTATPVVTTTPVVEVTPTPEVEEGNDKPKCNQGLGNGSEGCDPGNSNHNQVSNDEGTNADGSAKMPGNGGRKNSNPKKTPKPKKNG